jgi:hypothetical protein
VSWLRLDMTSAAVAAAALVVLSVAVRPVRRRWAGWIAAAAAETALVCGLFALWQLANRVTRSHIPGGLSNGDAVWSAERWVHLPPERWMQDMILGHPTLVRGANYYYATAHLTGMFVFLVWLWLRHRDRYPAWRNTLALFTGMSLLVQMIPVAPPRLIGGTGLVDTAARYGQSVYDFVGSGLADQYAAMPSIHVGWALLIAAACWTCTTGWWRVIGVTHGVATTFVVVATANHYWLDGVAAAVLLVLAWWLQARLSHRRSQPSVPRPRTQSDAAVLDPVPR